MSSGLVGHPLFLLLLCFAYAPVTVDACSRVLYETGAGDVYVTRTFDWESKFHTNLVYMPKGRKMDGGCNESDQCKTWTTKYSSILAMANDFSSNHVSNFTGKKFSWVDDGVIDGANEEGFAVHTLFLASTRYPTYKPVKDGVIWWRWSRYLLDTCSSVAQAVKVMKEKEIVVAGVGEPTITLHIAVDDQSGDSAIFEFVDGEIQIYDKGNTAKRDLNVLTNDPVFPEQIEYRNKFIRYGDELPNGKLRPGALLPDVSSRCEEVGYDYDEQFPNQCLPGDITGKHRFVRLSWFRANLRDEEKHDGKITKKDADMMMGDLRTVLGGVFVPHGAPDFTPWDGGVYPTWWFSAFDFQRKLYFWQYYRNPYQFYVDLKQLSTSEEVLWLEATDAKHSGDVTSKFVPESNRYRNSEGESKVLKESEQQRLSEEADYGFTDSSSSSSVTELYDRASAATPAAQPQFITAWIVACCTITFIFGMLAQRSLSCRQQMPVSGHTSLVSEE